jgi:hypothetical protein
MMCFADVKKLREKSADEIVVKDLTGLYHHSLASNSFSYSFRLSEQLPYTD